MSDDRQVSNRSIRAVRKHIHDRYEDAFRCMAHGPDVTCPICVDWDEEEPDLWWPGEWDDKRVDDAT